jgi:hypothetical protein
VINPQKSASRQLSGSDRVGAFAGTLARFLGTNVNIDKKES